MDTTGSAVHASPPLLALDDDEAVLDLHPLPPSQAQGTQGTTGDAGTSSAHHELRAPAPTAKYVTVSAVLSRSGAVFPLDGSGQALFRTSADDGHDGPRKRTKRRSSGPNTPATFSSGNALEAIGALWLHRDSKGRAASLSSQRWAGKAREANVVDDDDGGSRLVVTSYRAFLNAIRGVGTSTLGLRMPSTTTTSNSTPTIAERRRRKNLGAHNDTSFVRTRARRNQPTFEVATTSDPIPHPRAALRRSHSSAVPSSSTVGSTFGPQDPPDAPPSPIGMPGDWPGGKGWRSLAAAGHEDAALLLPPPLLDDQGSSPQSFEGLLGVKRRKQQQAARKRLQMLAARNRPAHKVGMLTALTNFVKAAHAADQATKAFRKPPASRPGAPVRRHTEAFESLRQGMLQRAATRDDDDDDADDDADPVPSYRPSRQSSLVDSSMDSVASAPLQTVLEGTPGLADTATAHNPPPQVSATRRSSLALRGAADLPQPQAPRLLPIQMMLPEPSPFTSGTSVAAETPADYLSARPAGSGVDTPAIPHAPRIGPTTLELPPSPWTSLDSAANAVDEQQQHYFSLSMTTSRSTAGVPGTPRLAPTHLSVLPSPFPSAAPSRIGSPRAPVLTQSPSPLKRADSAAMLASPTFQPLDGAAMLVSPTPKPLDAAMPASVDTGLRHRRESTSLAAKRRRGSRLTPAGMLEALQSSAVDEDDDGMADDLEPIVSAPAQLRSTPAPAPSTNDSPKSLSHPHRSFLLWWFIGDLGLGARSALTAKANDPSATPSAHIVWTICAESLGFFSFCLVHLVDLAYETVSFLSMAFWFLRWLVLNLLGKTVLSQCVVEAYRLIRAEWSLVAAEDHEDRSRLSKTRAAGLSKWQVGRGIVELVCLQAVTRERWIREGAGLHRLDGWQKKSRTTDASTQRDEESSESEDEETDLIITRRDEDILEFTRTPRIRPRGAASEDSASGYFAGVEPVVTPAKAARGNRSLVRKLKWASRLAIGAYGLHVHIVDLPPTFTPSGNRFTRQTFAHLSRLSDPDDVLHADIQQMTGDEYAYQPTFYVARDHVRKMIVVAVRGTQSFSDIIADLDMRTERFPLPDQVDADDAAQLTCHAGVLRAAQGLVKAESSLFKTVSEALKEHQDFGLTLVGHSLGAAIASAVVMLLGHYDGVADGGDEESSSGTWQIRQDCGLPAGRPIQAVSLASPATFSAALSARAAMGSTPLVTSFVLGADIIPRAGHGQARELRRVLGALSRVRRRLTEKQMKRRRSSAGGTDGGDGHSEYHEDARVYVLRSWWKWRNLRGIPPQSLTRTDRTLKTRIEDQLWKLRCDVEADLYTATKNRASAQSHNLVPPSPWVGPRHKAPLHQLATRRQALDSATLQSEAALGGVLIPAGKCYYLDQDDQEGSSTTRLYEIESPASFFSLPEFVTTLFASHLPASYEAVIEDM